TGVSIADAPGGLFAAADAALARARAAGALRPIASEATALEEAGISFAVRRLAGPLPLARIGPYARAGASPPAAAAPPEAPRAPAAAPTDDAFADPEPALVGGAVGDRHLCLLNQFPVLGRHLLLVTRAFAPQEGWLDA